MSYFFNPHCITIFRSKFDRGRENGHWRRKDGHLLLLHQVGRLPYGLRHRRPLPRVHWVLSRKLHLAIGVVNNHSKFSRTYYVNVYRLDK